MPATNVIAQAVDWIVLILYVGCGGFKEANMTSALDTFNEHSAYPRGEPPS
jgi:hypothetical protein